MIAASSAAVPRRGTLRLVARDEHGPWRDETAITVPIAIRLGSW